MSNEFIRPIRFYHADTDAGGVVFHANYFRYMEWTRKEWLRKCGSEHRRILEEHSYRVSGACVKHINPYHYQRKS